MVILHGTLQLDVDRKTLWTQGIHYWAQLQAGYSSRRPSFEELHKQTHSVRPQSLPLMKSEVEGPVGTSHVVDVYINHTIIYN